MSKSNSTELEQNHNGRCYSSCPTSLGSLSQHFLMVWRSPDSLVWGFFSLSCSLLTQKSWNKDWRSWPGLGVHHSGSHLISLGEGNCRCLGAEQGWATKKVAVTSSHKPPQGPPPCRDAAAAGDTGHSQSSSHCCCMRFSWQKERKSSHL